MGSEIFIKELERQIPDDLAHLSDAICEGLPDDEAKAWPGRVLAQITQSGDFSQISNQFIVWLLSGEDSPIAQVRDNKQVQIVAELYRRRLAGDEPSREEWTSATGGSQSAANAAWEAAFTVSRDAADAAAAAGWAAAARDAKDAAWRTMADKLEELIKAAPRRSAQLGGTTNE